MEMEQSSLYNIMIACLKKDTHVPNPETTASLSVQDWHKLLELSAMQRIMPLLWHRLKQKNLESLVPEASVARLRQAFRLNTLTNLRLNAEMSQLLAALETEGIPLIPLKGIVLANTVYENISLREMNDIDVLAHSGDLKRIADILTGMGYRPMRTVSVNSTIQTTLHLPGFIKKDHARIEVHWNITHPNKNYSIEPHGLWERAVPMELGHRKTQMLSAEDMLLHLCLHTSYLHPFTLGLRPFCDIAESIDFYGPALDWQAIAERAASQHWQRGIYLALSLAVEMAGAAVPTEIMEKLQPAEMTETIMETARIQILSDKDFVSSITRPFAQLLESRRLKDKLKIFRQRIFLPRAVIANAYSIPVDSLRIYGCYLRRFYDVLINHGRTFRKFSKKDPALKSLAERTKSIADWMD